MELFSAWAYSLTVSRTLLLCSIVNRDSLASNAIRFAMLELRVCRSVHAYIDGMYIRLYVLTPGCTSDGLPQSIEHSLIRYRCSGFRGTIDKALSTLKFWACRPAISIHAPAWGVLVPMLTCLNVEIGSLRFIGGNNCMVSSSANASLNDTIIMSESLAKLEGYMYGVAFPQRG